MSKHLGLGRFIPQNSTHNVQGFFKSLFLNTSRCNSDAHLSKHLKLAVSKRWQLLVWSSLCSNGLFFIGTEKLQLNKAAIWKRNNLSDKADVANACLLIDSMSFVFACRSGMSLWSRTAFKIWIKITQCQYGTTRSDHTHRHTPPTCAAAGTSLGSRGICCYYTHKRQTGAFMNHQSNNTDIITLLWLSLTLSLSVPLSASQGNTLLHFTCTFMQDAFIQSDLHLISSWSPWESNPWP